MEIDMIQISTSEKLKWERCSRELNLIAKNIFDVTFFTHIEYGRLYDDGSFFLIDNENAEITYQLIDKDLVPTFQDMGAFQSRYVFLSPYINLPDTNFREEKAEENIRLYLKLKNICSRFYIVEYSAKEAYHMIMGFHTIAKAGTFVEYVMSKINLLERFFSHSKSFYCTLEKKFEIQRLSLSQYLIVNPEMKKGGSYFPYHSKQNYQCIRDSQGSMRRLTSRESQCLLSISIGNSAKQTARYLSISNRTVEKHIENIMDKTGFRSIIQLLNALGEF